MSLLRVDYNVKRITLLTAFLTFIFRDFSQLTGTFLIGNIGDLRAKMCGSRESRDRRRTADTLSHVSLNSRD